MQIEQDIMETFSVWSDKYDCKIIEIKTQKKIIKQLVEKLCKYIGVLEPYTYFNRDQRITIDDTLEYFQLLL